MKPVKKDDGMWHINIRPWGRDGKQIKRKFPTRIEANQAIQYFLKLAANNKPWLTEKEKDKRTFSELTLLWYQNKGVNLSDGNKAKKSCLAFSDFLNNPIAKDITPQDFFYYATERKKTGTSDKTNNNHLGYIKAVYNHLNKVGVIDYPNPLSKVELTKIAQRELAYLTKTQIDHLLDTIKNFNLNPHVLILTKICLSTGSRWGEAESLTLNTVKNGKFVFTGKNTKNKKTRAIPVSEDLFNEVVTHLKEHGPFTDSISSFRRALEKSGIKSDLPSGQASHVLRHTFASWFMINGGNILVLQRILDHFSLNETMRYAHLAPDHLEEALELNPLAK